MESLTREQNGNVVLRSGNFAMRFDRFYGGTPLEWYADPYGMLTNRFPGSGTSAAANTGQDPTQASANGPLENPICIFGDGNSSKFNYYAREAVFEPGAKVYQINGFFPDFWLSAEWADDSIAVNGNPANDNGWRTVYHNGGLNLNVDPGRPVAFQSSSACKEGLFFVGNELLTNPDYSWNERLRSYGQRRVAAKLKVSMHGADANSIAGILFGVTVPDYPKNLPYTEVLKLDHTKLVLYRKNSTWELSSLVGGQKKLHKQGTLSSADVKKLRSPDGLQIEIRTHNYNPAELQVIIEDKTAYVANYPTFPMGQHFALYANNKTGKVTFSHRQVWDVGVEFSLVHQALPEEKIQSGMIVRVVSGTPSRFFYRTNLPGIFINPETFPIQNRILQGYKNGEWHTLNGIYLCREFEKYWIGSIDGVAGICAENIVCKVNTHDNPNAHLLIQDQMLMLNALDIRGQSIDSAEIDVLWSTKRT